MRFVWTLCLIVSCRAPEGRRAEALLSAAREPGAVVVRTAEGREVLRYSLEHPAGSDLPGESACYFHPFATPRGIVLTDVAPADHRWHRGVFLAFVEVHGAKDADFWGWGQHAPTAGRKIVNRAVDGPDDGAKGIRFRAKNEWNVDDFTLFDEILEVRLFPETAAHVLDLTYTLIPRGNVELPAWAFSGFCVRLRKDGRLEAEGPEGRVERPDPKHTDPSTDWPAAAWYAYTLHLEDGNVAGAAVMDHPDNPKSLWHNHRKVRMLNPSVTAAGKRTLKAGAPLVLRYRVVAYDGEAPRDLLSRLAREWE